MPQPSILESTCKYENIARKLEMESKHYTVLFFLIYGGLFVANDTIHQGYSTKIREDPVT